MGISKNAFIEILNTTQADTVSLWICLGMFYIIVDNLHILLKFDFFTCRLHKRFKNIIDCIKNTNVFVSMEPTFKLSRVSDAQRGFL